MKQIVVVDHLSIDLPFIGEEYLRCRNMGHSGALVFADNNSLVGVETVCLKIGRFASQSDVERTSRRYNVEQELASKATRAM